ncbi:type I DNA topoisomerase [Candidatus Woesebacteria bacterium]|nr:type I DNA topoisomerase [Candidatus Woesebacteria bacterium]
MNLVIVESPTKARKLSNYLGSNFKVEASVGHIRDLPKNTLGVDLDNEYEPTYQVSEGKQKVITQLKKLAEKADKIYLATDPDREGEAIAWHIKFVLEENSKKKKPSQLLRATFHEITKSAVMRAIDNPGEININLVDAQQARRVVDRLVGYTVSPVLWKKIRRGLSAGRVQSVALRMIVEREKEITAFVPEEYWEVDVLLGVDEQSVKLEASAWLKQAPEGSFVGRVVELDGKKYEPTKESHVAGLGDALKQATYAIGSLEKKQRRRVSLAPFTTSTLQQKAATQLGMSAKQTMSFAQQLYEEGLITYHRTDSVALSDTALQMAREFITTQYGQSYLPEKPRLFAKTSKNAQEAHEAIRVTDISVSESMVSGKGAKLTERHAQLYDLIWRRYVASQMVEAVYAQTTILTDAQVPQQNAKHFKSARIKSVGSILEFDGWMKLFPAGEDVLLPQVNEGQTVYGQGFSSLQKFTQPPPRFNDASLVKELEKKGIGRPSTYASIISVIEDRGYIERQEKKFIPTAIGITVNDFLVEHFPSFMEYEFTAEMEEDLDRIARGEKAWRSVVGSFFVPLNKRIQTVTKTAERAQIPVEKTGETCPKCGEAEHGEVVIRVGRFGKFKSCSRYPECDYTDRIVEVVGGVTCPLCQEGQVTIKNSRWGKQFFGCSRYPECDWASWKQPEPGQKVTKAEWAVMQAERKEKQAARLAKKGIVIEDKATVTKKKPRSKKARKE